MPPPTDVQDEREGLNEDNQTIFKKTLPQEESRTQQEPTRTIRVRISKPPLTYIPDITNNRYEVNFNFQKISNEVMKYDWRAAVFLHK